MIAFLDTEFTHLVIQPRLLSAGLVTACVGGPEFYAEVTDRDRLRATGWFALGAVLPQFGRVANAGCSYRELGARLSSYFADRVAELENGELLEVAYGYHLDWELVEQAIRDAGSADWAQVRQGLRPVNVYDITGFGAGEIAAQAYFKSQAGATLSRHHALCDARALRLAHQAALRSPDVLPLLQEAIAD